MKSLPLYGTGRKHPTESQNLSLFTIKRCNEMFHTAMALTYPLNLETSSVKVKRKNKIIPQIGATDGNKANLQEASEKQKAEKTQMELQSTNCLGKDLGQKQKSNEVTQSERAIGTDAKGPIKHKRSGRKPRKRQGNREPETSARKTIDRDRLPSTTTSKESTAIFVSHFFRFLVHESRGGREGESLLTWRGRREATPEATATATAMETGIRVCRGSLCVLCCVVLSLPSSLFSVLFLFLFLCRCVWTEKPKNRPLFSPFFSALRSFAQIPFLALRVSSAPSKALICLY
jgi:hypothetical protein